MTKYSNKFKKSYFWTIFPIFRAKIPPPPQSPALSHTTPHRSLTPCRVSGKTNKPIPRKLLERRTEGQKDRRMEGWTDPNS